MLGLLILVTHWTDAVSGVTPFLMYVVAGHHDYFKSLIVGIIVFAKNVHILICPVYAIQATFLPCLDLLKRLFSLWSDRVEILEIFFRALVMRYDLLILH